MLFVAAIVALVLLFLVAGELDRHSQLRKLEKEVEMWRRKNCAARANLYSTKRFLKQQAKRCEL